MSVILRKIAYARKLIQTEDWTQDLLYRLTYTTVKKLICGYDQRLTPGFNDPKSMQWKDASIHLNFLKGTLENKLFLQAGSRNLSTNLILGCFVSSSFLKEINDAISHFLSILEEETKEFEKFKESKGKNFFRQTDFSNFEFQCGNSHLHLGRVSSSSCTNVWQAKMFKGFHLEKDFTVRNVLGVEDAFYKALNGMDVNDFLLLPQDLRDNIANGHVQR